MHLRSGGVKVEKIGGTEKEQRRPTRLKEVKTDGFRDGEEVLVDIDQ